jgi:hypothetical protein
LFLREERREHSRRQHEPHYDNELLHDRSLLRK